MARQLTTLGKFVAMILKWIAVPLLAAFIGSKLIGPIIAAKPDAKTGPVKRTIPQSESGKKFQSVREGN